MGKIEDKIITLGFDLPETPQSLGSYIPARRAGTLVFVSGQLPKKNGNLITGKLGADLSIEQGQEACKTAFLNALSAIKSEIAELDNIDHIVRMAGYINCTHDFYNQADVMNGASNLAFEILGEKGRHARLALGTNSLPLNACCELEVIVKIKE